MRIRDHASEFHAETSTVLFLSLAICAHASAWKLVLLLFLTMFVHLLEHPFNSAMETRPNHLESMSVWNNSMCVCGAGIGTWKRAQLVIAQ